MVFVWGHKGYHDILGYIIWECPSCETTGVFSVEQVKKKFTVYFIPTFSYSQKQFLVCTTCQATFEVPAELKPEVAQNLMSQEELSYLMRRINEESAKLEGQVQRIPTESLLTESGDKQRITEDSVNYCPSCGYKISGKMTYCSQCGRKLRD